ncbi:MAG: HEAT repeat domain-containing protein [Candidatus Sericytochromatia bacterium]
MILIWVLAGLGILNALLLGAGVLAMSGTRSQHARNQEKARFWEGLEHAWEPLLDSYLVRRLAKEDVWSQIPSGQELYFVDYLMRRALMPGTHRESLQELATPFLPALAGRLAGGDGDSEQRARAVQTLALLGQKESQALLVRALEDESPLVTLVAAMAVSQQGNSSHATAILSQLTRLADWHLGLLSALLIRMGPEVQPAVRSFLENSDQPDAQTVCLQVLARLGDVQSVPLAVRLLSRSQDVNVQVAALSLLGQLGSEEHLPLIRARYDSPHFAVRLAVIRALHSQQSASDQPIFQKAFEDSSRWVALQAAQALKAMGHQHVLHELTFLRHPRSNLASQVLNAFESSQDLEEAVQNPEFKSQIALVLQRLQEQDNREVQQLISRLFFSPKTHPEVRYAIARELARFRNYQFFYQTLSSFILGAGDRRSLIRALHSFANPEAVPALIDYYRSNASNEEKLEIVDALGAIDSVESLEFLSRIYNDLYERGQLDSSDSYIQDLHQRLAAALAKKMTI